MILLSRSECLHIAYRVNVDEEYDSAGGEDFRLQFIRAAMGEDLDATIGFDLTWDELWLLDSAMIRSDPRGVKTPNGSLVTELLVKIWTRLLELEHEPAPEASLFTTFPVGGEPQEVLSASTD